NPAAGSGISRSSIASLRALRSSPADVEEGMLVTPTRAFVLRLTTGLLLAASAAAPAAAVTDEEIFRDFRFNFANPGARALAMGGAFIAIANDATAAQANPARLGVLRRPEVFVEVRDRTTKSSTEDTGKF